MLRRSLSLCLFSALTLLAAGCSSSSANGGTSASAPVITLSAPSLTFPSTTVGQSSTAIVATATNTGNATATLSGYNLTGNTADFSLTSTCTTTTTLAAGASCTFSVTFAPVAAGSLSVTLAIADNATNSPQSVTFTGTGAASGPAISLTASSLAFPSTAVGQTANAQAVTIANTGGTAATISSYTLSGNTADFTQTSSTCGTTLAAGATCAINFVFVPQAAGSFSLTLSVADNAAGSPQTITFTGTGTAAPVATLSASAIAFPATNASTTSSAQTVMLTNSGNAALTINGIVLGGTNPGDFSETTTCGGTLAAGSSCNIAATFTPAAASTSYAATITITDNANNVTGATQTIALSGAGSSATPAPIATLSASTIAFSTTIAGTTTAAQSVTLTNTGNATLNIASIVLGGTNAADFTKSTTCGTTLAASASCTISATFSPPAAATASYAATLTLTDNTNNVAGSTQTIALTGAGTTSTVTHTLYTFPEADNSVTPLYNLINSAQKTIDMTMYELQDTTFVADLVAACKRGVVVRVVLSSSEASSNSSAYSSINGVTNCSAVESNSAFVNTHQKTITIDNGTANATTAILSLNLQSQYYSTTRDFAYIENDPADIAAIEATFQQDYAAGGTNSSTEFAYVPGGGDNSINPAGDLIWSPTTAQANMLSIIQNAKSTILLENEEMSASNIVSALETACQNGIIVHIAMVNSSSYTANFNALKAAGCGVYLYPDTSNGFYVHAKAVVADYGLPTQMVYMGSINYSLTSMNSNRELGIYIYDSASVTSLYTTMAQDYSGNPIY
jgi:phosphatidylserine/phosphatidylglycerophosphate/cardiolipin synthase-like enzyme